MVRALSMSMRCSPETGSRSLFMIRQPTATTCSCSILSRLLIRARRSRCVENCEATGDERIAPTSSILFSNACAAQNPVHASKYPAAQEQMKLWNRGTITVRYRSSEPQFGQKRSSPPSRWRHSTQKRLLGAIAVSSRKSIAVWSSTLGP